MTAGKLLWKPDPAFVRKTNMSRYLNWLKERGQRFGDYQELWKWSVEDLEGFWGTIWKYFDVADADYVVLGERKMPGAKWFEGADLNFAEHVFRGKREGPAIISKSEKGKTRTMTWVDLERRTAALSANLSQMGVVPGDRVAAILPNTPEAVVAFLACASIGGIWSCCSPDFGGQAVLDRFSQITPKVLIAVDGYSYGGKWYEKGQDVEKVAKSLPSVENIIAVPGRTTGPSISNARAWDDLIEGRASPEYEQVLFDHPLWILYSSGTTGMPKPIVHGHGGILVELLKALSLHNDIRPGDRFFWFTTTGWMMWNYLVGGLLHGAAMVLYDGSPSYPDLGTLWEFVQKTETTFMGLSAAYLSSCMKEAMEPKTFGLAKLRGIGSTGSPLPPAAFEWVYAAVKEDVWLASVSGGTDVCTGFVGGCPTLPVYSGEIQCRCLGASVEAYDYDGKPVVGKVGELVVTQPMPSMPLFLWGDDDVSRYKESYFDSYPGVWRHGDWLEITTRGTCIIYGRSDATIKRMGVRIGTSEIYRSVESMEEVADSLAIEIEGAGTEEMILFVSLVPGRVLDAELESRIRKKVRTDVSPRHVPDSVVQVPSVPKTLNGKKLEVPIKRILMGADPSKALNPGSIADPSSLDFYIELARRRTGGKP